MYRHNYSIAFGSERERESQFGRYITTPLLFTSAVKSGRDATNFACDDNRKKYTDRNFLPLFCMSKM